MSKVEPITTVATTDLPDHTFLARFKKWPIEEVTKALALFAALCYVAGFAITTIYTASLGLPDLNPLRPKIAYVGFIFFLLAAPPIFVSFQFMRVYVKPDTPRWTFVTFLLSQLLASLVFSGVTQFLFVFQTAPPDKSTHHWWYWPVQLLGAFAVGVGIWFADGGRAAKIHRKAWLYLIAAVALTFNFRLALTSQVFSYPTLSFWFAATGIVGGILSYWLLHPEQRRKVTWETILIYVLYLFTLYPIHLYPHIKPAFAGGSLRPVRVLFTRDSSHFACMQLQAQMIEETDAGFYLRLDDQRTLFVPRSSVEALSYSQAPISTTFAKPCIPKP